MLVRAFVILFILFNLATAHAADGKLEVRYVSGAWQASKPDNSTLTIDPATYGLPEALAYAAANGQPPLFVYCPGPGAPLTFVNYTLQIPSSVGQQIHWYGCALSFGNGAQPGLQLDTLSYGAFLNTGGQIRYSGTGPVVLVKPCTSVPSGAAAVPVTTWSRISRYDFGALFATGGSPEAQIGRAHV